MESVININEKNHTLFPLTNPQKRIWYNEKIFSETSIHNIIGFARVKGIIDFELIEKALNIFIANNPGLRLKILEIDNEVFQHVDDIKTVQIEHFDFSGCENHEEMLEKYIERLSKEAFNILDSELYRFYTFKISESETGVMAKFHHIICDGWSAELFTRQVFQIYSALLENKEHNVHRTYSYTDYICNEVKYLSTELSKRDRDFWMKKFEKLPEFLYQKQTGGIEGSRVTYRMNEETTAKIRSFGCSLNTFITALVSVYFYRYTENTELAFGIPILNRSGVAQKNTFGMFTSTMPLRIDVEEETSFKDFLNYISKEMMSCFFHQKYPYNLLVKDLNLANKDVDGLFNISINCYNTTFDYKAGDFDVDFTDYYSGYQFYNLQVIAREWGNGNEIEISFDYKKDLYTKADIEGIYDCFLNIVDYVYGKSEARLKNIMLATDEKMDNILYRFNDTNESYPLNKTIIRLFEEQVLKTPANIALTFRDEKLSYERLNELSNSLAWTLIKRGISRDNIVGIMVTHSIEMFIAILGILKAGGAYLPIDPMYPKDRVTYMLKDSGASLLVTDSVDNSGFEDIETNIINIKDMGEYSKKYENPPLRSNPDSLAYLIYTSGSTGKPKGTMIEHKGLVNYICWAKNTYVKASDDVFAVYSSLAFDLTVTSVFVPLISGILAAIYRDDEKEYVLHRILQDNRATIVKLTPSHLSLIQYSDNRSSSVRRFIVGGEDLKASLSEKIYSSFGGNIEIYNEYGPTETVVGCMIHKYRYGVDKDGSVPIGIPTGNVMIYILDKNLKPVVPGQTGEMFISGSGVARGYMNKPDITQKVFLDNPFVKGLRMYKTGDLAFLNKEGLIVYKGRVDFQVKIKGFRIELEEIESVLSNYQGINQAVVIDIKDEILGICLCAYVISEGPVDLGGIKKHLYDNLPEYMVPAHIIAVDKIPLTPNGKVDRNKLPKPEKVNTEESVLPESELEIVIARVFKGILNIESIGINDSFYGCGGDSIKAIQASSKLNELGIGVSAGDIIKHKTIKKIIENLEPTQYNKLQYEQGVIEGEFELTPIAGWFMEQGFKNPHHYNQSVLLSCKADLNLNILQEAFEAIINHHDGLRINYNFQNKGFFYNNKHKGLKFVIQSFDIGASADYREDMKAIGLKLKSQFDISKDLMIKAAVIFRNEEKLLLITAHHLVMDAVSWQILIEQLFKVYNSMIAGSKPILAEKTASMAYWREFLSSYSKELQKNKVLVEYWKSQRTGVFRLCNDFSDSYGAAGGIKKETASLGKELTHFLMKDSNAVYNTNALDLLTAALYSCLRKFSGSRTVEIEMEGHGRNIDHIDLARTVGWFTAIYPVRLELESEDTGNAIMGIKEILRKVPDAGLSYGILRYVANVLDNKFTRPEVRFNYLGELGKSNESADYILISEDTGNESSKANHTTAKMEINCMVIDGDLNVEILYGSNEFKSETIRNVLNLFLDELRNIVCIVSGQDDVHFTPSDFEIAELTFDDLDALFE
jgi:amino acid adenylation domain-containing protein/non-ribosomal peptide synthase protein (TIGR01720 family)